MPRTTRTPIGEFAKHRFFPRYIAESRSRRHWGGCSLLLHNCTRAPAEVAVDQESDRLALGVVPLRREGNVLDVEVVVYNWTSSEASLEGLLRVCGEDGEELRVEGPSLSSCRPARPIPSIPRASPRASRSGSRSQTVPRSCGSA